MGRYTSGDVVLASVRIGGTGERKVRPAVIVAEEKNGTLLVCPVSSTPPPDAPCVRLSLYDFIWGGLDLFGESYVLTAHPCIIRTADVVGKKGVLTSDLFTAIKSAASSGTRFRRHSSNSGI
jgi:mRNA interferase MazF